MAIEVFSRYEKKYLLTEDVYLWLLDKITPYMEPDKFNKNGQLYNIANIYYDTPNDALIWPLLKNLYTRRNSGSEATVCRP